MSVVPYLSTYWTLSGLARALNANPVFAAYAVSPGPPDDWQVYGALTAAEAVLAPGLISANACRMTAPAGVDQIAIHQRQPSLSYPGPGWYVLEAQVTLTAGALTGAGVLLSLYGDAYETLSESLSLCFSTDSDLIGVVNGAGTPGQTYGWRKLVQAALPTDLHSDLIAFGHLSTLGSVAGASTLDWSRCSLRPASLAEIAAGNAVNGLPVFPLLPGQTPTVKKTSAYSTKVKRAASGRERRTALWPYPLWSFEVSYEVLRQRPGNDELLGLWEVFEAAQGQYGPILFLDPSDWRVTDWVFGAGDGATTQFQLTRPLRSQVEPVLAPFGVVLSVNGVRTTAFSLDPNGVVAFASPPPAGAALSWSGGFYYLCRFAKDQLTFEQLILSLWKGESVKLTSIRA